MSYKLIKGDCRQVLEYMPSNSIDSVVTDPPYALVSIQKRFGKSGSAPARFGSDGLYARASRGFMGKSWDNGEVAFAVEFWSEVLRVLKPGGHVVAFGGTRTYHRIAVAIEDAGFEIRDQLGWLYGSGFPKSHNQKDEWEGWGTALKPAWESICFARKPLGVPKENQLIQLDTGEYVASPVLLTRPCSVAENLSYWGVGALNIDGCRVATEESLNGGAYAVDGGRAGLDGDARSGASAGMFQPGKTAGRGYEQPFGRWPANIVHDGSDEVLAGFPYTTSGTFSGKGNQSKTKNAFGAFELRDEKGHVGDSGSAARFFYCAKASRRDRDEGLDGFEKKRTGGMSATADGSMLTGSGNERTTSRANTHPTVKPTALMQWLCRLVTPPGGTILDPFMGSGSTGKAAVLEGFRFIGCEREDEYMPIAEARIRAVAPVVSVMTTDKMDVFA